MIHILKCTPVNVYDQLLTGVWYYLRIMVKEIDIPNWDRRESYELFKEFEDPFFGLQVELDVTLFWAYCKNHGLGIHHSLLYAVVKTANSYAPMKLRRRGNSVVQLDLIHIGCSVLKTGTEAFTFAYYPWKDGLNVAEFDTQSIPFTLESAAGAVMDPRHQQDDIIYGTTLPWVSFSGFKHAKKAGAHSIPRIVIGKMYEKGDSKLLPFQLEVDHALMDGFHASQYLLRLQANLDSISQTT